MNSLKDDFYKEQAAKLRDEGFGEKHISDELNIKRSTLGYFLREQTHTEWWAMRNSALSTKKDGAVIKIIDIENSPIIGAVWGLFNQNLGLNQIVEDWYILSYACKTLGKADAYVKGLCDFKGYKRGGDCEKQLVEMLWHELDSADFIIAHNGISFDNKKIKAKFLEYGMNPPSPYRVIDTLKIAKDNFKLTSNKLDYILTLLEQKGKLDAGGMETWLECRQGCPVAWEKMKDYNLQDVTELEPVYLELRSWDTKHPNIGNYYEDAVPRCVVCGSENLVLSDKDSHTNLSIFSTLVCQDCGHNNRDRKNKKTKEQMKASLMNSNSH